MLIIASLALLSASGAAAAGCAPAAADSYSGAVLADNPLAYFRHDEAGGPTLCDSAAQPHEGSYVGGVSFGTAGALVGSSDSAITATAGVGTAGLGVSGNHDFTLEGWFRRTTSTQNQALVAMGATGAGNIAGLTLWTTTTTGSFPINAASTIGLDTYSGTNQWDTAPAGVNIWDGQWHYMAISYSAASGQATAYVDGHSLGTQTPQPLNITAGPLLVGKWVDTILNQPLIGSVDEVAVYPTALSAARIAAHYAAAGTSAPPPPPGMHGSTAQIICNYEVASSQDICTATVGDPSAAPLPPTGTVRFTSANGGAFPFGATCTLAGNPASGATTSCSVQFIPLNFPAVFPRLTASYAGDAKHTPSSGSTFFGGLGKPNETVPPSTSVKQESENQVSIEVDVPVSGTAVTACALSGGAGASAAGLIGSLAKEIAEATAPLTRDVGRATGGTIKSSLATSLNGELQDVAGGLGQLQQALGSPFASPAPPLSIPSLESILKTLIDKEKALPQLDGELQGALKQVEADQAAVLKLLQNMQSQCKAAVGAFGSSLAASIAKKHPKRGRALATVRRRNVAAGRLHLKLRISSATLKKLAKGKKHVTLTVPVNMVLPSKRFSRGFPLLSVQHVTLDLSKHKKKHKKSPKA